MPQPGREEWKREDADQDWLVDQDQSRSPAMRRRAATARGCREAQRDAPFLVCWFRCLYSSTLHDGHDMGAIFKFRVRI